MDTKYCVKCFVLDNCVISIVCNSEDLFNICESFSKNYSVKAFILNNDKEI